MTRRNFIVWWLAGLLTATGVAIIAPLLVYIWPPATSGKAIKVPVKLDKGIDQLADDSGVRFDAPPDTAFTMQTGGGANAVGDPAFSGYIVKTGGKLYGWSSSCSHLGCSINLNPDKKEFECPCHGSRFHLDGTVLNGPAAAPLAKINYSGTGGEIQVEGISTKRNFGA